MYDKFDWIVYNIVHSFPDIFYIAFIGKMFSALASVFTNKKIISELENN